MGQSVEVAGGLGFGASVRSHLSGAIPPSADCGASLANGEYGELGINSPQCYDGELAGGLGFEPRQAGPEPAVLPLHHPPIAGRGTSPTEMDYARFKAWRLPSISASFFARDHVFN